MTIVVAFIQGLFELIGLVGFLVGYFGDIWLLMVICGCLVVLDDVIDIIMGLLNPLFPLILAIILAVVFTPWYIGIFWASAVFKVLDMPGSFKKIFMPHKFAAQAREWSDEI